LLALIYNISKLKFMKVMHVDVGNQWRGGQRQCALLHSGLLKRGIYSSVLANTKGELISRAAPPALDFRFGGELSPATLLRFRNIIHREKPDIVHSHEAHSLTPLVILNKFMSFKLVHTRRVDFHINKSILRRFKYINPSLNLVAISKKVKQVLVDDGVDPLKINIIYSGVPKVELPPQDAVGKLRAELGIGPGTTVFGTVANFSPHKDLPTMLKAYAEYVKKDSDSRLLMVGDGPLYKEVRTIAHMLRLNNNIIFTGFQEDVPLYMGSMDVFLVSSELEGLNTSIIDAMHMGLPVVATDAGGIGELVESGVTGYLAPVGNPVLFADRMKKLAQDKNLIKEYSINAQKKAEKFTDDAMVENYLTLYSKVLGEK
jgi:glycosyltransferase involved in cell wall biosynthesis